MDWKLLFIFVCGLLSDSVASLIEKDYQQGGLPAEGRSNIPTGPQHTPGIHYYPSNGGIQGISPFKLQSGQTLPQYQEDLTTGRQPVVPQYFQEIQPQNLNEQTIPKNNVAAKQQLYNTPLNQNKLSPFFRPTEIIPKQQFFSHQNVPNAAIGTNGWNNGQQLNQQYGNLELPFNPMFGNYYNEPYSNYGNNYGLGLPNQPLAALISNKGQRYNNNYGQVLLPQNQYQHVQNPVGYSQWPDTGYNLSAPKDQQHIPQPYASVSRSDSMRSVENESSVSDQLNRGYQNDNQQTVPSEQPVDVNPKIRKRYVIVHSNGSYEQVDNLNLTDVQNLPKHALAIIEVEDKIEDLENEKPFEDPVDKGISQIPQDDNWASNNKAQFGTNQMYKLSTKTNTEFQDSFPHAQSPNEDIDMFYFNPEYLMPIQSTSATNTEHFDEKRQFNKQQFVENLEPPTNTSYHEELSPVLTQPITTATNITSTNNDKTLSDTSPIVIVESPDSRYIQSEWMSKTALNSYTTGADYSTTLTTEYTDPAIYTSQSALENKISIQSSFEDNDDVINHKVPLTREEKSNANLPNDAEYYYPGKYIPELRNNTKNDIVTEISEDIESTTASIDNLHTSRITHSSICIHNCNEISSTNGTAQYYSNKGAIALNEENQEYYKAGEKQIFLGKVPRTTEDTNVKNDVNSTSGDDLIIDVAEYPVYPQAYYNDGKLPDVDGETMAYVKETAIADTPINRETSRKDLEVDVSNLKTVVDDPIVWFRPDENFWDKVTQGENSYDFVTFYDVHCKPKLIEKHTTVHHFPNGTEVREYVETIWNSANDLNPKEVKTNTVVKHPDGKDGYMEKFQQPSQLVKELPGQKSQ